MFERLPIQSAFFECLYSSCIFIISPKRRRRNFGLHPHDKVFSIGGSRPARWRGSFYISF